VEIPATSFFSSSCAPQSRAADSGAAVMPTPDLRGAGSCSPCAPATRLFHADPAAQPHRLERRRRRTATVFARSPSSFGGFALWKTMCTGTCNSGSAVRLGAIDAPAPRHLRRQLHQAHRAACAWASSPPTAHSSRNSCSARSCRCCPVSTLLAATCPRSSTAGATSPRGGRRARGWRGRGAIRVPRSRPRASIRARAG